jgi:hypothetical protein
LRTSRLLSHLVLLAALAAGSVACRSDSDRESQWLRQSFGPMVRAVRNKQTGIMDMRNLMRFDWDRLIVLPPLATPDVVKRRLGFEWEGAKKSLSQLDQRYLILAFVKGQKVTAWTDVDRERTSFDPLLERGYVAKDDAVFTMRAGRRRVELDVRPAHMR